LSVLILHRAKIIILIGTILIISIIINVVAVVVAVIGTSSELVSIHVYLISFQNSLNFCGNDSYGLRC